MQHKAFTSSPFGCIEITGSERGISAVRLTGTKDCPEKATPAPLKACVQQLKEYFARQRTEFDLPLDWTGATDFYKAVWEELIKIPYGHTFTYSGIANNLGDPNKMRAVGQANRNNPIGIIVPCHRVIAKNGDLQGYFSGLDMKRRLLELENPMSFATQGQLF